LHLSAAGTFFGSEAVVFLAPAPSEPLLRLQRITYEAFVRAGARPVEVSMPGDWFPHCSLAMGVAEPAACVGFVQEAVQQKVFGSAASVCVVRMPEGQTVCEYNLG